MPGCWRNPHVRCPGSRARARLWPAGVLLLLSLAGCAPGPSPPSAWPPTATLPPPPAAPAAPLTGPTPSAPPLVEGDPVAAAATPTAVFTPTANPCTTPGVVVAGTYPSTLAGPSRYRIYLPPCYGQDGRVYPTLYMLPGNIHTDSIWDDLGLDETAAALIQAGQIPPLLIVMADGGWFADNTSGGPGSYESIILDDLIPFIEGSVCAWPQPAGRALGGMSRGGYWALAIAFRHPDQFASVGGHSAALLDQYAGPDVNPQFTGPRNPLGALRIYLDIGAEDWVLANVRQLHVDLEAAGVAHAWVLNDGRHEDAYWSAHLADYLRWYTAPWPTARDAYPPCD
jgi:enterochelin esterase-like enzyme